jgi:hypothetical protein
VKESVSYDPIELHSPPFNPSPLPPPPGGGDLSSVKHTPTKSPVPTSSNNNIPYEPKTEYEKVQRKISSLYEVRTPKPTTKKVSERMMKEYESKRAITKIKH